METSYANDRWSQLNSIMATRTRSISPKTTPRHGNKAAQLFASNQSAIQPMLVLHRLHGAVITQAPTRDDETIRSRVQHLYTLEMIKHVPEFVSRPCMAAWHIVLCLYRRPGWVIKLQAPNTPENVLSLQSLLPDFAKIYADIFADVTLSIGRQ